MSSIKRFSHEDNLRKEANLDGFVINRFPDRPDLWKVLSITHPNGSARKDGRYPARIGCIVVVLAAAVGKALVWSYVADADGNEKQGGRTSGRLNHVSYDPLTETLHAESKNSRYRLKMLPEKWGDIYAQRSISLPDWYSGDFGAIPISVPIREEVAT